MASVSGMVYDVPDTPTVQLFTKEGCTLCDNVKGVLSEKDIPPHSLEQVDITDVENETTWYAKYKWDIPVLHINGMYWTKHRLTVDDARDALEAATDGRFVAKDGEPNAAAMEEKQTERRQQQQGE